MRGKIWGKTWEGRNGSTIEAATRLTTKKSAMRILNIGPGARFLWGSSIHPGGEEFLTATMKTRRFVADLIDSVGRKLPLQGSAYTTYEPLEIYNAFSKGRNVELIVVDRSPLGDALRKSSIKHKVTFIQDDITNIVIEKGVDLLFGINVHNIDKLIEINSTALRGATIVCQKLPIEAEKRARLEVLEEIKGNRIYQLKK